MFFFFPLHLQIVFTGKTKNFSLYLPLSLDYPPLYLSSFMHHLINPSNIRFSIIRIFTHLPRKLFGFPLHFQIVFSRRHQNFRDSRHLSVDCSPFQYLPLFADLPCMLIGFPSYFLFFSQKYDKRQYPHLSLDYPLLL